MNMPPVGEWLFISSLATWTVGWGNAFSSPSPSGLPEDLLRAIRSRPDDAISNPSPATADPKWRGCVLRSLLPPADRSRAAEAPDEYFYDAPMIVQHNDDAFRWRLSSLYTEVLPPDGGGTFLDLGSSWVSHLPDEPQPARVWLHGMNLEELDRNPAGNGWRIARSFNDPDDGANGALLRSTGKGEAVQATSCLLPEIPAGSVDVVGVCAAFQYWRFPERVAGEILRVLKSGGRCVVSFSNRMFPSKAVVAWMRRGDRERLAYVSEILEQGAELEGGEGSCSASLELERTISKGSVASLLAMPLSMMIGRNFAGDPFLAVVAQKVEKTLAS